MLTEPFLGRLSCSGWVCAITCPHVGRRWRARPSAVPAPDQTRQGWDAVAETYERAFEGFTEQFAREAIGLVGLKSGERVLDVAAGTGTLAMAAARQGAEVVAVDFSPAMIRRLWARVRADNLSRASAEVMDGQALAFRDNSFDAVFSVFGLVFFPDLARGFHQMWRVLKPGGRAAVVAWSSPDPFGRLEVLTVLTRALTAAVPDCLPAPGPPAGLRLQDPKVFESRMREAGFRRVRIHTLTRTWTTPSPEWLWNHLPGMWPGVLALFERLGSRNVGAAGKAMLEALGKEFGDGPVRLQGEAHIGVGVK